MDTRKILASFNAHKVRNVVIHPFVTGVTWETVWQHRVRCEWEGVVANFASLDDLITMKRAAGRGKDLDDLRYLEKIREIKRKRTRRRKAK